jgi:hypothetical protein
MNISAPQQASKQANNSHELKRDGEENSKLLANDEKTIEDLILTFSFSFSYSLS